MTSYPTYAEYRWICPGCGRRCTISGAQVNARKKTCTTTCPGKGKKRYTMFIVFEGVDGSGKTTQAKLLHEAFEARKRPVRLTREPSDGAIGTMIRAHLTSSYGQGQVAWEWETMSLLFAADRRNHMRFEVEPALDRGIVVISDRYVWSNVAYQLAMLRATAGMNHPEAINSARMWIEALNRGIRVPDVTILLDADPEATATRLRSRTKMDMLERVDIARRVRGEYDRLYALDQATGRRAIRIDATGPVDLTHARIVGALVGAL